jgi:hypothetical protein
LYVAAFIPFVGFYSTTPFDAVIAQDVDGVVTLDNVYFGPGIPAPGGLAVLGLFAAITASRRRRSGEVGKKS